MNREKDIRVVTPDRVATFNKAVGNWLKEARLKSGKTVGDGAVAIDSSIRQIEDIESGARSVAGNEFHALVGAYELDHDGVNEFLREFGLKI